ncbi:MAG: FAD:protein FMN transferase [Gammaproteobacteria bacterium]|jgi:thiamine biosynthesis lipoprotein
MSGASEAFSKGEDTHRRVRGPAATVLWVVLALGIAQPADAAWVDRAEAMMGTRVSVRLWHDDEQSAARAADAALAEIDRIERLMSTYREDSAISRVNREAAAHPVPAGEELYRLVETALRISRLTDGAFDITFDSVGRHYDYRAGQRPDEATIEREIGRLDYRLVTLVPDRHAIRFERDGVRINLGGIAKGYAVERAAAVLADAGVEHAIVTAGGDSRLLGDRAGEPWVVGVRDPRSEQGVAVRLPLVDEAISTSGDYERYFEEDGVRYHHILSPATGQPARGVYSASVVGPDAVLTDGLSTSVFVLGVDRGLALIEGLPGYEAIIIDASGRMHYSSGLMPPTE